MRSRQQERGDAAVFLALFVDLSLSLSLKPFLETRQKKKKKTHQKTVALLAAADKGPRGLEKYFSNLLGGQAEFFSTLGLPDWLVHWGHPGNMAGADEKGEEPARDGGAPLKKRRRKKKNL